MPAALCDRLHPATGSTIQIAPCCSMKELFQWPTFHCLYSTGAATDEADAKPISPDQMQGPSVMQKWTDWIGEGFAKGWLVDAGDALTHEGKVVHSNKVVTDGPFVESKEIVGGYSIVQADSITAAAEIAKGCPGLLGGGKVEVRVFAGLA